MTSCYQLADSNYLLPDSSYLSSHLETSIRKRFQENAWQKSIGFLDDRNPVSTYLKVCPPGGIYALRSQAITPNEVKAREKQNLLDMW